MLRQEIDALTELERQDAIAGKLLGAVIIVGLMVICLYMIYCWYKAQLAEQAARVQRQRWTARTTRIAFEALQADDYDRYEKQIASLRAQNTALVQENTKLRTRLDTLVKAKGVAHDGH